MRDWLDTLDATGRWALLKLVTGGLRVGASARLAKLALAEYGRQEPAEIEEVWHGLAPPYTALFAWLDGRGPRPAADEAPVFRPLMLAHPVEGEDLAKVAAELHEYYAEWKWDGIRVQIAATSGGVRLYSRSGDDISNAFPDLVEAVGFQGVLDGELLVKRAGEVASFNELQQRLNRKAVTPRHASGLPGLRAPLRHPVRRGGGSRGPALGRAARAAGGVLRPRAARRAWTSRRWSRSPGSTTSSGCAAVCAGTPIEGLMLKRKDSPYLAGRPKGLWWKWKRDALLLDVVLMYAQRGHGKRSSFYSDFTFGAWRDGPAGAELVPVGKAYSGYTDAELVLLDKWIRDHTTKRYGPVREVSVGVGARGRVQFGAALDPPQIRRRYALPAHPPDPVGQARGRGRSS